MKLNAIGRNLQKTDAYEKVTGAAIYVGDMRRPDMLYAKILRSPHAHANIRCIDVSGALALEGVAAALTWEDAPQIPFTTCGHPYPPDTPEDTLILSRRLRYVGDPVAAVAAETPEIAARALELIKVEYELLPAYLTPEAALADGAMELHEGLGNICGENHYEIGDVAAAMAGADHIIEDEFHTPIVTHTPMEAHISMTELDQRGRLIVHSPTQVVNILRERLAHALGMRIGEVRVIQGVLGGSFGSKQETVYEPVNALLTLKTRRPVMLALTREECIAFARTRHSADIKFKTGYMKDGSIVAREMSITQNTGAYASHGHNVILNISTQFALLYPTPNIRFSGLTVYTNILIAGAFRGYGIPQYNFAMESHIDNIARRLGRDPLEYRKQVMLKPGDPIYAEHFTVRSYGLDKVIEKCGQAIGYEEFRKQPKSEGNIKRGIGVSICSYAQTTFPHGTELSGARVKVSEDGSIAVFVNSAEIGQGSDTVMRQIAADTFGVPVEWATVISGDTDICPFDVGAFASRQTHVAGHAVKKAALACKDQILQFAAVKYSINRERLDIEDGNVVDGESGAVVARLSDVTMKMTYDYFKPATIEHEAYHSPSGNTLTFGATAAIVEADVVTGKIEIKKLASVIDCGRLINPLAALGQLSGGNIMSLGFALSEQIIINEADGSVRNDNLLDYKIPTFADVPDMEGYFIETDEPSGPYGNKALGEPPIITPAAAVRNAVLDATGVALHEAPMSAQRVFDAIRRAEFARDQGPGLRD